MFSVYLYTDHVVLTIDAHLKHVKLAILAAASKWKDIGRALDLTDDHVKTLDHGPDDKECLHRALSAWIHTGKATVYDLLKALEDPTVERRDIANQIRNLKGEERINVGLDPDTTDVDDPKPESPGELQ